MHYVFDGLLNQPPPNVISGPGKQKTKQEEEEEEVEEGEGADPFLKPTYKRSDRQSGRLDAAIVFSVVVSVQLETRGDDDFVSKIRNVS